MVVLDSHMMSLSRSPRHVGPKGYMYRQLLQLKHGCTTAALNVDQHQLC